MILPTRFPLWLVFSVVSAILTGGSAVSAQVTLARDGESRLPIVLVDSPSPAETTAARELAQYLEQVVGSPFAVVAEAEHDAQRPAIYLGSTRWAKEHGVDPANWKPERWQMRTVGESLILAGGRPRGTLYAAYHFLEDVVGVRWWSPFEEGVPNRPTLSVEALDRQGEPRFRYRDIHLLYAQDDGRFAARSRINGGAFGPLSPAYGCGVYYGPPGGVHTFNGYIPPDRYFAEHPEWFSLIDGKRTSDHAQWCLTNPQLRQEVIDRLKAFIAQGRKEAEAAGRPAPVDFDISQNDWYGWCQCPECQALADAEGSQSGPLLTFLNQVADAVAADYPDIRINTLAYQASDTPPKTFRPRETLVPRLCDTEANLLRPVTHADNRRFAERVAAWGAISKELWIWDYAVTYTDFPGLPLPTVHTYATDYRYLAENNVTGIFTEHEYAILADMRDLKIWMMVKLLEDPYQDDAELLRDFTDGFYGPAGAEIRRYLADLQRAADTRASKVTWFPALSLYDYLTFDFAREAHATFDRAEAAVGDDAVLLRRVRHARLPLDRASLVLWPKWMRQWTTGGGQPEAIPLDRDAIGKRCRATWSAQIDLRFPEGQRAAELQKIDDELAPLLSRPAFVRLPEKFRTLPARDVIDFTAEQSSNWENRAQRVPDPQAECGITNRLVLSEDELEKYKLPMPWGLYVPEEKRGLASGSIRPEDVPGAGYHWYCLGRSPIRPTTYVWFFWSWIVQFPVDAAINPQQLEGECEVWARIRFEGPAFPHGNAGEENAISVERVVLVRVPSPGK